jgi:hypothetical protein
MPFRTEYSMTVAAPIKRVFELLEDAEKSKAWRTGLVSSRITHEPPGSKVGTTFAETVREGKKTVDYTGEVTHWSPPTELGVRIENAQFFAEVIYRLAAIDDSRTRLRYICHTTLRSRILTWLLGWYVNSAGRKMAEKMMLDLKRAAESNG